MGTGGCVLTAPTNLLPQTTVTAGLSNITWSSATCFNHYLLRIDDLNNGWVGDCGKVQNAGDVCNDNASGNSYSYTFLAGHTYHIWIHAINSFGILSDAANSNIATVLVPTPSPTVVPTATPKPTPTPTPTPVDKIAPKVSITYPLIGSGFSKNTAVTIKATATDNVGVSKVLFYYNNNLLCTVYSAPFNCNWTSPNIKTKLYYLTTITARAYDLAGNSAVSSVSVFIR
jgi:hypothetical protein